MRLFNTLCRLDHYVTEMLHWPMLNTTIHLHQSACQNCEVRVLHVSSRYSQHLHTCMSTLSAGKHHLCFRVIETGSSPAEGGNTEECGCHDCIRHTHATWACSCGCVKARRAPPACAGGVGEVDRMMWWSAHSRVRLIWPETRSGPFTVVAYRMGFWMPPLATRPPSGPPSNP